ncbi:hypothetical protein KCU74_g19350, partial [Aureobasidium melanogenum]
MTTNSLLRHNLLRHNLLRHNFLRNSLQAVEAFVEISNYVADGETVLEQSLRMQEVIRKLARLGNATYEASKSYDNSFSFHAVELLREAAGYPLWRKHVVNPKAEKTPEEKQELEEKRRRKEEKKKRRKEEKKKRRKEEKKQGSDGRLFVQLRIYS